MGTTTYANRGPVGKDLRCPMLRGGAVDRQLMTGLGYFKILCGHQDLFLDLILQCVYDVQSHFYSKIYCQDWEGERETNIC